MENNNRPDRLHDSDQNNVREDIAELPRPRRSSRKTFLIAAIVSVITIGTLIVLRDQVGSLHNNVATQARAVPTLTDSVVTDKDADIDGHTIDNNPLSNTGASAMIVRAIEDMSDRIKQWFDSLSAEHSSVNRELTSLAASMSAIHASIDELRKGNDELKQRVIDVQSRFQAIAQDVQGLKLARQKKAVVKHKQAASVPPFLIDAIDLWDDTVFVAVSQNGRAAFLREGEQQAGWRVTHIDRLKGRVAFHGPEGQGYSTSIGR